MTKSIGFRLIFALGLMASSHYAFCTISPLYEVQLPTQTQDEQEWHQLCQQGLTQIFERTLSSPQSLKHPEIQKALKQADEYVEQYYYNEDEIVIKFSSQLIEETVAKLGTPVIATAQQSTTGVVLWLGLEENDQRRLIGVETDPQLQTTINQLAREKGIELVLPLMDLEDIALVTPTDVWGQFPSVLTQASQRYNKQTILVACLSKNENTIEGKWRLYWDGKVLSWQTKGTQIQDNLAQGIALTIQHLNEPKEINSYSQERGKPYLIGIDNIDSSEHFRQVAHYLKTLNGVVDVRIQQVIGQAAVFEVTPNNRQGRETFEKALMLDGRFSVEARDTFPSEVARVYRWGGTPHSTLRIETASPVPDPLLEDEPDEEDVS